jgi:hypothetical protein
LTALGLVLATAGCGGDEEEPAAPARTAPPTATVERPDTAPTRAETEPSPEAETPPPPAAETPAESPEDQPGGAGDEVPARSQALFTGRGGRIAPSVVRVPPFIAIRVELRSADGRAYVLRFGDRFVRADREIASVSAQFAGLRPGRTLRGARVGAGNGVRVVASAEPGP